MKNTIVKIIALFSVAIMILSFSGCGKKAERILYNVDLKDYVTVGKYEGLTVDTASDEFKEYCSSEMEADVAYNAFYSVLKEGKVENGDNANIDYEGKKDGVAFEGGTAKGHDLLIGSNQFIDGFESGLIGVEIGSTVDLNLKFPDDYGNEELNGAQVVFTVKVNSVEREMKPSEYFSELGFKSEEEYMADVEKRAAKTYLVNQIKDIEVKEYPQKDVDLMQPFVLKQVDSMYQQQYGMTIESVLSATGQTMDDFKKTLNEQQLYPTMKSQMALYYILDNEKFSVSAEDIDAEIQKVLSYESMKGVTKENITEYYGRYYFEYIAVESKVKDFLYEKAVIK